MTAFITGSRAYGVPREDSDWDIGVLLPKGEIRQLVACFASNQKQYDSLATIRVGRLNLLLFSDSCEFDAWREATRRLKEIGGRTREQAIACIVQAVAAAKKVGP